jgi:hypothetical protein
MHNWVRSDLIKSSCDSIRHINGKNETRQDLIRRGSAPVIRKLWLRSARVPWRSGRSYGFQSLAHKQIWVVDVLTRITRQTRSEPKQFRALAEELDERQEARC